MSQEKPLNLNARVKKTSHEFGEVELLNVSRKATPEQIKKFLILYAEVCPDAFRWSSSIEPPAAVYAPSTQPEPKLGVGDQIKQKIEKLNEANNNSAILARAKKALQEKKANEPLPQPKAVEEIPAKPAPSPVLVQPPKPDTVLYQIVMYLRDNPDATYTDITTAMHSKNIVWDQVRNTMAAFIHLFAQRVESVGGRHVYRYSLTPELLTAMGVSAQKPEESKPVERKPAPLFELHLPAKGSNQRKFIDLIRQRPGIGATGIAEALGIARDNTTASLFDLHRRGLVQRNAGLAKDGLRLAYCYSLTPATEKALKAEQASLSSSSSRKPRELATKTGLPMFPASTKARAVR